MSTTELIQSAVPLPAQTEDSVFNNCKVTIAKREKPSRTESTDQDRETFFRSLQSFHESRNTPITRLPKINGREVDLFVLYNEVTNRGGWLKVNIRNEWNEVVHCLGLQERCVNAPVAVKTIYTRYLDKYERLNFLGEDPDKADDLDDDGRPKKWASKTYNSIPMTYNYRQHDLNDEQRNANRMSEDLYKGSEYDKLLLSLISPLPNEQDFAINVCTLMSNESKHTLKLDHCPKLLDALLAHAGVFCHYTMRELFQELYSKVRKHSLQKFWKDLLYEKPQILELSYDDFLTGKNTENEDSDLSMTVVNLQDGLNADSEDVDMRSLDFLSLGPGLGTQEYIGQRVHQVSSIIRNLSFFEENTNVLAKNRTFIRFLVMGANIRWGNLHHMVLDMFGNIANELDLQDPTLDELTRCLMSTICEGIESSDRGVIISCLEVLYKICQQDSNEDHIHKCLNQRFYDTMCLYLSLNDIMLLLYTLEAIYALSSLGHRACNSLVQVKGVINSLMSLITVEAQSYGPDGCILMRVVETVPGNMLPMVAQNIANIATLQNAFQTNQPTPQRPETISQGRSSPAPVRQVPEPAAPTHRTQSPTNQDHENFALSWLSATFEPIPSPDSRVEHHELYRMYLSALQKFGRRGVVAYSQFPRMVRTIFGAKVVPNYGKKGEQTEGAKEYYVCIRVRANPLPIQVKNSLGQKLLKDGKQKIDPGSIKKTKKKIRLQEQLKQEQLMKQTAAQPAVASSPVSVQKTLPVANSTPGNQQSAIKIESNKQIQSPHSQSQSVVKIEPQVVTTPVKISPLAIAPKTPNPNQPQIIGNVVLTPSTQTTLVQQAAKPLQITTIVEQPQVALHHQIPASISTQQQLQIVTSNNATTSNGGGNGGGVQGHPSSSLVKSLLANKVAQRQQKQKELAAQQQQQQQQQQSSPMKVATTTLSAVVNNPMMHTTPIKVGQTTIKPLNNTVNDRKTTIISSENSDNSNWDPIPPLAPLSTGTLIRSNVIIQQQQVLSANDDSSSASMTSSIISSSQIEGDGSFASFEGLLLPRSSGNKIVSTFSIDDDSSKDSLSRGSKENVRVLGANQMLVDLLDKKALDPPISGGKRKHDDDSEESEEKKILLEVEPKVTASKNAANLYAEMAASILEDEDLEEEPSATQQQTAVIQQTKLAVQQQQQQPQQLQQIEPQNQLISMPMTMQRQLIVNPNNPHQMILSQGPQQTTLPTATATIKTDQGLQTVNCILQKTASGQQILQPMMAQQQQPQTQYVLATNPQGQTYLVAQQTQPQQQTQRLLVTQTPQQQAAGTKTIIILQQQGQPVGQQQMITTTTQPQKVIMTTPQGQQMIVTQMPRPVQHQIYMNTGGTNVIQTGPIPVQQQIIQKQIQTQPGGANILSQLSHIPATIKIHQSTPIISQSPATTVTSATSLSRLGKSVSIVQQQGVPPPPQTQVTPAVMQTQIVQHTGTPGGTEKRQVIISGGRTIEITDSTGSQQGHQLIRMIQPTATLTPTPIPAPTKPLPQIQPKAAPKPLNRSIIQQQSAAPTPAVTTPAKNPTPPPPAPSASPAPVANTTVTPKTLTPANPAKPSKTEVPKADVKNEVKPEQKTEPKVEKMDDDSQIDPNWLFVCDWRNCPKKKFKSVADLHHHACLVHCPDHLDAGAEIFCQWGNGPGLCDGIPRKRFSLMTHILDRHLTSESLRGAVQKRLANGGAQQSNTGQPVTIIKNQAAAAAAAAESTRGTASPALSTSSNGSVPSTGSAALHAIKRHATDFINPKELMDENEGPVTKSIRLTAALILRNLVTYTPAAKKTLRQYEPHLASVALSNVESSGTISQILFELNN